MRLELFVLYFCIILFAHKIEAHAVYQNEMVLELKGPELHVEIKYPIVNYAHSKQEEDQILNELSFRQKAYLEIKNDLKKSLRILTEKATTFFLEGQKAQQLVIKEQDIDKFVFNFVATVSGPFTLESQIEGQEFWILYIGPEGAMRTDVLKFQKKIGTLHLQNQGEVEVSYYSIFLDYVTLGFEHILPNGLDHILFITALFLSCVSITSLLWQITAFTFAHSITLGLSLSGLLVFPANWVEVIIALSIVITALENYIGLRYMKLRLLIVFIFGLIHGMGFAQALRSLNLTTLSFITSLLSFNLGVEIGQCTVLVGCYLIIGRWFSHYPWYKSRILNPLNILIALIGLYWTIQRIVSSF